MNNFIKIKVFVLFLFLVSPQSGFSQQIPSEKRIFDNGMTVVVSEMPGSPVVCVYGFVKSGSATEGKFLGAGISHLTEHMVFKGTEKRKAGEIPAQIQAVGGTINASTNKDYTVYTISVPYKYFDVALDVLSDMLMHAAFDPEEFKKEKEVVANEIRLHRDNPDRRLNEMVFSNVYLNHPYRHPIIGYESLFLKLTREDALKYYKKAYTPSNMVISIAGRINRQEAIEKTQEIFENFERQIEKSRNLPIEPQQISSRYYEEEYPTELARFVIAFQGVNVLHEDLFALDMLAAILGEGQSSRLYQNVYKNKQLVYSISAESYTPLDKGFFDVEAVLDEKNLDEAIKAVWEEIKKVQKGISKEELKKIKKKVLAQYILGRQTASNVTGLQALDEAFTGDYLFWQKYIKAVENLKEEDIVRVARKYLKKDCATTVVLRPTRAQSVVAKEQAKINEPEIKKILLDNGIVVLLREDHTFPVVSMSLMMSGGLSQEPEDLNGVANLTASLLTKGTKSKNAQEIARLMDSLGFNLSGFSGKNNFGIRMECLSEDFLPALDLFEDIFKNPTFSEEELGKEKERVKAAIKAKDDSILKTTNRALKKLLFLTHPLRFESEGSLESVERIQQKDVASFYSHFINSRNMVISVFGDIKPEDVLGQLEKRFGLVKPQDISLKSFTEEPPAVQRQKRISMKKEQAMMALAFQGPNMFAQDRYGVEVLTSILGSSFDGRMFRNIREKLGKAYSLGGSYSAGVDMGLIYFYVLTTKEDLDKVESLLTAEINNLKEKEVPEEELKKIKTYLKGRFWARLETNAALVSQTSADEFFGLGFKDYKNYESAIDKITAQDIKRMAVQYLNFDKSAVVFTTPKTGE